MTWDVFFYVRVDLLWRIATTDDPVQAERYRAAGCVVKTRPAEGLIRLEE